MHFNQDFFISHFTADMKDIIPKWVT